MLEDAGGTYFADGAVQARFVGAVDMFHITVGAGVAEGAATRVRALAGVEAGAAVTARPMVGAAVEILVAEQSAPAFVAQTVPRLVAPSVRAARIAFALVARFTGPAAVTSVTFEMGETSG